MTTRPRSGGPASPAQDVANLGLVRPPLVYLISLVSGVVIQFATPFATPSRNAGQAGGTASRGGCHSAALVLGCDLLGRRHACTRAKAHHRDRTHGPLSLQPKPDLSGVFAAAARYRDLGQQRVAAGHARRGGGTHPLCRHTERRAAP